MITVKYKPNKRITTEDGTVIYIHRDQMRYVVSGFYKNLDFIPTKIYMSFEGVQNHLLNKYGVELVK